MNLAAAVLANGPIADQVKEVKAAVEAKNRYYHDRIFRGVVLANVSIPDWLDLKVDAEAKRKEALAERLAKMPELDAAVKKALTMKSHTMAITPVK